MKTSLKLLIVFFIMIPITLFAYNYVLKQQYIKGEFVLEYKDARSSYINRQLPAFKHLVVDARLHSKGDTLDFRALKLKPSQNSKNSYRKWEPTISLSTHPDVVNQISFMENFKNILRTKVVNDTLYVFFYKENARLSYMHLPVDINIKNQESITLNCGIYRMNKVILDHVKLNTTDAEVKMSEVKGLNMDLYANNGSSIYLNRRSSFQNINYSILNDSFLEINTAFIKNFTKGKVDKTTKISISGGPELIEKYLSLNN